MVHRGDVVKCAIPSVHYVIHRNLGELNKKSLPAHGKQKHETFLRDLRYNLQRCDGRVVGIPRGCPLRYVESVLTVFSASIEPLCAPG